MNEPRVAALKRENSVVIRFAGDSGDGMQLTGTQFTTTSALLGNDFATSPTSRPRFAPRPTPCPG